MKEVKEFSIWDNKLERKERAIQAYPEIEKEVFELPDFIWESAMLIADNKYTVLNSRLQFLANFDRHRGERTREGEIRWLLEEVEKAPDWIKNKVAAHLRAL